MKNRFALMLAAAALAFSSLACQFLSSVTPRIIRGSGEVVTEERQVSGFSEVDFGGIGNLFIELGEQEGLVIEAEDNFLQYIETEVRGETLIIRTRENVTFNTTEPINFYLTASSLNGLSVSGLGDVEAPALEANQFSVAISGGGDLNLEALTAGTLTVSISGLGNLTIGGGQVDQQQINISGGGNYNGEDLASRTAGVDISGLGNATLRVSENLDVAISGGGSVRYIGSPSVDESISGLGNVEQIEP